MFFHLFCSHDRLLLTLDIKMILRLTELAYLADIERVISGVLLQHEELVPHPVSLVSMEYCVLIFDSDRIWNWTQRYRVECHGPAAACPLDQHQHAECRQSTPFPMARPDHGVGRRRKTKGEKKSMWGDKETRDIQQWTVGSEVCSFVWKDSRDKEQQWLMRWTTREVYVDHSWIRNANPEKTDQRSVSEKGKKEERFKMDCGS